MGALFASNSLLDKSADDVVEEGLLTAKDKTTIMIMGCLLYTSPSPRDRG